MTAFVAVQFGATDARCDVDAVAGRCDPVVVAVANQDRAGDRAQPVPHIMTFPRLDLGLVGGHGGWVLLILPSRRHPLGDGPIGRVSLQPLLVPAAVHHLQLRRHPLPRRQLQQLLQWIGGPAFATGRRARHRQSLHPPRMGDGELLGHHAAKTRPDQPARLPPGDLQQASGVSRDISHGVRMRHWGAAAKTTVVPCQQIEAGSEGIKQRPDVMQGQPRPVAKQQPGTTAPLLPMQLNPVHMANRHRVHPLASCHTARTYPCLQSDVYARSRGR